MGLTEIQKEMIRGIATNNILKARQGALGALNEDTTQKNKNFVARYKSILTSEHGFLYGKCIKQLYTPKVLGMLDESLPTLKCKFRLSKENSKTISIDPATGIIASNSTEEKISVSSDGKVTIKSTEKETYIVECVISADHYKTLVKPIYIYVR